MCAVLLQYVIMPNVYDLSKYKCRIKGCNKKALYAWADPILNLRCSGLCYDHGIKVRNDAMHRDVQLKLHNLMALMELVRAELEK